MTIKGRVELAQTFIGNIKECSVLTSGGHGSFSVQNWKDRRVFNSSADLTAASESLNVPERCVNGKADLSKVWLRGFECRAR
jgi:hypothetical protein